MTREVTRSKECEEACINNFFFRRLVCEGIFIHAYDLFVGCLL